MNKNEFHWNIQKEIADNGIINNIFKEQVDYIPTQIGSIQENSLEDLLILDDTQTLVKEKLIKKTEEIITKIRITELEDNKYNDRYKKEMSIIIKNLQEIQQKLKKRKGENDITYFKEIDKNIQEENKITTLSITILKTIDKAFELIKLIEKKYLNLKKQIETEKDKFEKDYLEEIDILKENLIINLESLKNYSKYELSEYSKEEIDEIKETIKETREYNQILSNLIS